MARLIFSSLTPTCRFANRRSNASFLRSIPTASSSCTTPARIIRSFATRRDQWNLKAFFRSSFSLHPVDLLSPSLAPAAVEYRNNGWQVFRYQKKNLPFAHHGLSFGLDFSFASLTLRWPTPTVFVFRKII